MLLALLSGLLLGSGNPGSEAVAPNSPPPTHPTVSVIYPRGGKRGTDVSLRIYGQRLQTIQGLQFFRKGIEVLEVKPDRANRALAKIRIAKDCPLGRHEVLVRTEHGLSNLRWFFVGTLAEVTEKEPNNTADKAQPIKLESTINGRIENEDEDVFAIDVKKGQNINIEVQGLRLGDREFDCHLTVEEVGGRRLAQVDDTIFGLFDPLTSLRAEKDGRWLIRIRENARGGSSSSFYRMHVGTFPRPMFAFPAGGKVGAKTPVEFFTENGSFRGTQTARPGLQKTFITTKQGTSPTPIVFAGSGHENVFEAGRGKPQAKRASISPWWLLGPFTNPRNKKGQSLGHNFIHPPEKTLKAAVDPKKEFVGRDGKIRWTKQSSLRDNQTIDLRRIIKKADHSVVYLHRTLTAETARRVLCLISGDDTIKVWCNGKLVLNDAKPSGITAHQHRLLLNLEKGPNVLLVKLANRSSVLGFHARILDPHRYTNYRVLTGPAALNGIIAKPGEYDYYVFLARAREALDFRVIGRRVRSPIDPNSGIYCTHDRFYVGNDDTGGMDSLVRFRAPFTGEFVFRINDLLRDGSPRHVYRVHIDRPRTPAMTARTSLPGYIYEWCMDVPKGGRNAIMISTSNLDRRAGTKLALTGLPKGVTARIAPFERGATSVPVVFGATQDTAIQGALLGIDAKASVKGRKVEGERFLQTVAVVQARNQRTYLASRMDRLPLAVTRSVPFKISVRKLGVPLIRGSRITIPFQMEWAKGFKGTARVRMLYNPSGITSGSVQVKAGQKTGALTLYCRTSTATGVHKIVLVAMGPAWGANVTSSTDLIDLRVDRPWIEATLGKVRSTPNATVQMPLRFARKKKFSGKVECKWIGIPRDIACGSVAVTEKTDKLSIPIKLGGKAPPGRHRSFRLNVRVLTDAGPVTHDFYGGEIRVDRPLPKRRK